MVVNDNFGKLFALFIRAPATSQFLAQGDFRDSNNVSRTLDIYGGQTWITSSGATISKAQVGTSPIAPTRQDFKIGSPFGNSPEDSLVNGSQPTYNSGLGKIVQATLISPTGGSGTIKEVVKMARWRSSGGALDFLMSRNTIPDTSFIVGQAINIEHGLVI